ncbi:hypothetical protein IE81DRAFT_96541 [Ceraceosorus guamensis]|uniref:Uncharacterized protein n=1 Tax=Ceraceosorus guamensis TaxID=1522189 RepID=A0A316VN06_9BASI|nr:hypothetical protein IE81DRAFT_96541 [Ceraceosorus guamensis]PWN38684.1 hypothetical protein IE81DRAFT_96541 [Ceraceosorus guamensis]
MRLNPPSLAITSHHSQRAHSFTPASLHEGRLLLSTMVRSSPAAALTQAGCSYRSVHMLSGPRRLSRVQLAARAGTSKEPSLSRQGCPTLEPARFARWNTITAARATHAFAPFRPSAARLLAGNGESSQGAYVASKQSPEEYHAASDRTLNALIDHLEALTEEHSGVANEREAEYSA